MTNSRKKPAFHKVQSLLSNQRPTAKTHRKPILATQQEFRGNKHKRHDQDRIKKSYNSKNAFKCRLEAIDN
jgi:hypothetical protein